MSTADITKVPLTVSDGAHKAKKTVLQYPGDADVELKTPKRNKKVSKSKAKKVNKKASKPKAKPKPVPLSMRVKARSPRSIAVQIRVDKTEAAKILRDAKASGLSSMNAYGRKRLGLAA